MKLTTFINKSFGLLERKITSRWFNPLATLYVNFRTMPFNIAWHLPIYVYGRVKFKNLKGKIEFTCNVKPGLIKMGRHDDIYHHAPYGILFLDTNAKIIFNGYCSIAAGFIWRVSDTGILNIGSFSGFGNFCRIFCSNNIKIGEHCRITYNCILMDTNSHYTINLQNYKVYRKEGIIEIGSKNWIGNNSRILKGCKTGEGTIVTAGSMVNKDFSTYCNVLLSGTPAEVKRESISRCFSFTRENEINNFFKTHPQAKYMEYDETYTDPVEDLIQFFK